MGTAIYFIISSALFLFFVIPLNAKTFGIRDQGKFRCLAPGIKKELGPGSQVWIRNTGSSPSPFSKQVHIICHKNQLFEVVRGKGCPLWPQVVRPAKMNRGERCVVLAEDGEPITTSPKERELVLGNADLNVSWDPSPAGNYSIIHCKKSWRSSSTPASGDAGPNDTGVEQILRW